MHPRTSRRRRIRRGFNLVELLIALGISSALLTATMVALDASFTSYQRTTEQASTHTISRLAMHRILTLIRSGERFGPFPVTPLNRIIESNYLEIEPIGGGDTIIIEWEPDEEALYYSVGDGTPALLLEGVVAQLDGDGEQIPPFRLEYHKGRTLYRATVDLAVIPDDNMDVDLDGDFVQTLRLVGSAMPRSTAFN